MPSRHADRHKSLGVIQASPYEYCYMSLRVGMLLANVVDGLVDLRL
ncbi:MAG: hypothetical protein NTW52_12480 [Planctomycetota bacterium]|nr:hypothetical protein [Planctomycetota bacterium]